MEENKNPEVQENVEIPPVPVAPYYTALGREMIFGALMLVLAVLSCNFMFYGSFSLGFALTAAGLVLCSCWYLKSSGRKFGKYEKTLLGLSVLMALGFARSDEGLLKCLVFLLIIGTVNLGLCLAAGKNRRSPDGAGSLLDSPWALFVMGVGGMGATASDLVWGIRHGGTASRRVGAVTTGLLISAPLLLVMVSLLIQADAAFEGIMDLLPEFECNEWISSAVLGFFVAWILYSRGLRLARAPKAAPAVSRKAGRSDPLTVNTVLIMVDLVYVVYLFSQLAYLSGGLKGILPQGYTLSQYARRGFFEMAWLAAINLSILCICMHRVRREAGLPPVTKIAGTFLGAVTIFLVLTASAKMLLYIGSYGLTQLRVLTEVFMLWLAITTVLVTIRLFVPGMPYMKAVVLTGLILAALVFWVDVNVLTAQYNLNAYQSGRLEAIDVSYLEDIGAAGIPALVELTADADPEVARRAREWLETVDKYGWYEIADLRGWNLTRAMAQDALDTYRGK